MAFWGVKPDIKEIHPDIEKDSIVGYIGTTRSITVENIIGLSFKKSLKLVEEMNNNKKNDRYENFKTFEK